MFKNNNFQISLFFAVKMAILSVFFAGKSLGPLGVNSRTMLRTQSVRWPMDDFTIHFRNKECTYQFNNWSMLVTTLVMT